MNKTKKLIEESIMFAIEDLSRKIRSTADEVKTGREAQSIKILAEAYDIVHRGKKEEH